MIDAGHRSLAAGHTPSVTGRQPPANNPMRLGIFGGTFNPPHFGHLILAEEAWSQLRLDRVLWVLTADPPHKQGQPITPVDIRLAMLTAAIRSNPVFELSRVDIDRPGPHWTADTLSVLHRQFPNSDLVFLVGGDSLRDLPTWGRPMEILAQCTLGVMRRPSDHLSLARLEIQLPGISDKVSFVDSPLIEISARDIRRRVAEGRPYRYMMPDTVREIIEMRGVYRGSG